MYNIIEKYPLFLAADITKILSVSNLTAFVKGFPLSRLPE